MCPVLEKLEIFPSDEGEIQQIYGIIGSGKTYFATADIFDDLKRGQVVYANWRINFEGYDQTENKVLLFFRLFGLKRKFIRIPKENFHFVDTTHGNFAYELGNLTDCIIYLDEGHIIFDSYVTTKMPIEARANVLHTRHFNRTIKIIFLRLHLQA